jgi:hypothetical protein
MNLLKAARIIASRIRRRDKLNWPRAEFATLHKLSLQPDRM